MTLTENRIERVRDVIKTIIKRGGKIESLQFVTIRSKDYSATLSRILADLTGE